MATQKKGTQLRGAAKREAILAAAWEVFREAGYSAASMDEIARRAGGSKVSVYSHFGGKEALFEAVVQQRAALVKATLPSAASAEGSVEEVLTALAGAVAASMAGSAAQDLHRVALSAQHGGGDVGRLLYEHGTMHVLRGMADVVETRMKTGELIGEDPLAAAEALFGLLLGTEYIRFALGAPNRMTPEMQQARVARAVRIFLAAYRSKR